MNFEYDFIPYHKLYNAETGAVSKMMIHYGNCFWFHANVDGIVRIKTTFVALVNYDGTFFVYYADIGGSDDPKQLEYVVKQGYEVQDTETAGKLFQGLIRRGLVCVH